jgi:hypothetical protein
MEVGRYQRWQIVFDRSQVCSEFIDDAVDRFKRYGLVVGASSGKHESFWPAVSDMAHELLQQRELPQARSANDVDENATPLLG